MSRFPRVDREARQNASMTDRRFRLPAAVYGVVIREHPSSCHLEMLMHRCAESPIDSEYLDLVFTVGRWTSLPSIGEPAKCTELVWADLDGLGPFGMRVTASS